jgi:hypothetical protein
MSPRIVSLAVVSVLAALLLGCGGGGKKPAKKGATKKGGYVAAGSCFACRDRDTLLEAAQARKNDRETFGKLLAGGKIVPVKSGLRIRVLEVEPDGKVVKVRLPGDENDFWTLAEWLKEP